MQKTMIPSFTFSARSYCLLTKPGILMGNAITAAAGFFLASKGDFNAWLFLATVIGLSLVIASGCVFNNYIDRYADEKMKRTQNRPLVKGVISIKKALFFAVFLGVLGALCLAFFTNLLSVVIALFGFFVYVILYSFSKYHSVHGTLIGSVAGAVPPVVGYCAVSNQLDAGAWILFAMIVLWQMPHFFAIAIYRLDDYVSAAIPILPVTKGMRTTKIHMLLYLIAFIAASSMLVLFSLVTMPYLILIALLGGGWLALCLQGFYTNNDRLWARKMFIVSLIVIMAFSIAIPFTVI